MSVSFAVVRGFIGGAAMLVGGIVVTLMLVLFFQYSASVHNDRASASEPSDWGIPSSANPSPRY